MNFFIDKKNDNKKIKDKKINNKEKGSIKINKSESENKNNSDRKNENKRKFFNISKSDAFILIAMILIIIFSVAISPVTVQNDTFYTIKIGEHIDKYGIDMKDPFSWHDNLGYTYPHWLYDLLTYYIYSVASFQGIYAVTCLLSAILGISLFLVTGKLTKNNVISFIVTIGAMYVLKPYIAARAQLVTFILFIWTIFFIERFLETGKIRYTIPLFIIPIIIANIHVAVWPFYFVLYLPYIGEYLISILSDTILYRKAKIWHLNRRIKALEKKQEKGNKISQEKLEKMKTALSELKVKVSKIKIKRGQNQKNAYKISIVKDRNVKFLIIVMIICIFTGFLTPIADAPYTYLYKTLIGNTTKNINEHLPMTLSENTEAMCIIIFFLAILTFTKTRIRLRDLFFIGGLCYLMLTSRRQLTVFAIVGTVILTRLIVQMFKEYNIDTSQIIKYIMQPVVITFIAVLVVFISYMQAKPKKYSKYVSSMSYPVEACDYILENIDLGKARFYNEYNYGSYMLFRGIPVFIDSRADLYAPEFNGKEDIFMDFIETSNISTFYEDTFEKYHITHVITYKNSKMNMIIKKTNDQNYKQLYEDDSFTIYERLSKD